jgi:hypothetical protein
VDWVVGPAILGGYHLFYAACGVVMLMGMSAIPLIPERRAGVARA